LQKKEKITVLSMTLQFFLSLAMPLSLDTQSLDIFLINQVLNRLSMIEENYVELDLD
jgi:hypothetical protein